MIRLILSLMLIAAGASAQVRIMASPIPMGALAKVLHSDKTNELGRWSVILKNDGAASVDLAREDVILALGLPYLPPEVYTALLRVKAGGKWRLVKMILEDAGYAATIASGVPWPAFTGPALSYLEGRVASNQIPDITALLVDFPARIRLGPGEGATYSMWTGTVHQARVIGPVVIPTTAAPPAVMPSAPAHSAVSRDSLPTHAATFERAHDLYFGD